MSSPTPPANPPAAPAVHLAAPPLEFMGETGILFADLSGYTQLVYQCVGDEVRLKRLGTALWRLFSDAASTLPTVRVEGYAGDGFLALSTGPKPAREVYTLALALHHRFNSDVKALLHDLGFRTSVSLRTALHVGKVWRMPIAALPGQSASQAVNLSDAIVVAARVVTSQSCRRFGIGMTTTCYKRLLLAGGREVREPDEVMQDRNLYPEPIEVYRLRDEEREQVLARG